MTKRTAPRLPRRRLRAGMTRVELQLGEKDRALLNELRIQECLDTDSQALRFALRKYCRLARPHWPPLLDEEN